MCFDFTIFGFQNSWAKPRLYPPWVPRWDAPRSAAATVASSVPWSDISDAVVVGWQSGLKDLNIIKLESWNYSYGFIPLIRNLNNGFGFH